MQFRLIVSVMLLVSMLLPTAAFSEVSTQRLQTWEAVPDAERDLGWYTEGCRIVARSSYDAALPVHQTMMAEAADEKPTPRPLVHSACLIAAKRGKAQGALAVAMSEFDRWVSEMTTTDRRLAMNWQFTLLELRKADILDQQTFNAEVLASTETYTEDYTFAAALAPHLSGEARHTFVLEGMKQHGHRPARGRELVMVLLDAVADKAVTKAEAAFALDVAVSNALNNLTSMDNQTPAYDTLNDHMTKLASLYERMSK